MAGALWLGPQRSFVFRSYLLLVLRWAWGSCGFNTKHQSTKGLPGNSFVVYLVIQMGIWSTGSDDVGLTQSTKAPEHQSTKGLRYLWLAQ